MLNISTTNGPRKGRGWDGFLDDDDDIWFDAFETYEEDGQEYIGLSEYDEFDNAQEVVNFVMGQGGYENRNGFEPDQEDLEEQKMAMRQANAPECPVCLEEINEHLEEGAMRTEVDIDPSMDLTTWVNESKAGYNNDYDVRKTGHALAYCEDHKQATFFEYSETWFEEED